MTLEEKIDYIKVASYQMLGMWADMSQLVKLPELSTIGTSAESELISTQAAIPNEPLPEVTTPRPEVQFEDV